MARVVLLAIGSRGDVQPMAVLGGALKASGVDAKVIALQNYQSLVTGLGAEFVALPGRISDAFLRTHRGWGRLAMRSLAGQGVLIERWLAQAAPGIAEVIDQTVQPGDAVLAGILGRPMAAALAERHGGPMATVLFTAQFPTGERASHYAQGFFTPFGPYNRWGTRFNWRIANSLGMGPANQLRERLGLKRVSLSAATRIADEHPTLLAASPLLIPPAGDWPASVHQTGYWATPRQPFLPDPECTTAGRARPTMGCVPASRRWRFRSGWTSPITRPGCSSLAWGRNPSGSPGSPQRGCPGCRPPSPHPAIAPAPPRSANRSAPRMAWPRRYASWPISVWAEPEAFESSVSGPTVAVWAKPCRLIPSQVPPPWCSRNLGRMAIAA